MKLDPRTLNVTDSDGKNLGHLFDAARNKPARAAELKALFDAHMIDRDQADARAAAELAAVRAKVAADTQASSAKADTDFTALRAEHDANLVALRAKFDALGGDAAWAEHQAKSATKAQRRAAKKAALDTLRAAGLTADDLTREDAP